MIARLPADSFKQHHNRIPPLFTVAALCFIALCSCNEEHTAKSPDPAPRVADISGSSTDKRTTDIGELSPEESLKNSISSNRKTQEALSEQRYQSLRKLSTSALIASIRSMDLSGNADDRVVLPKYFLALAEKDPNILFSTLKELPGEYYKAAIVDAFPYLAKENPEILRNYVLTKDFTDKKDKWLMLGACRALGRENPENALSFFDVISDENKRGPLGVTLLKHAASEKPDLVVDFLKRDPTSPYFTDLFRDVLYTVLEKDPSSALKLASSFPGVEDTNLSAGIYTSMARKNPKWALEEMFNASSEVREEIFSRYAFDDKSYFSKLFSENPVKTVELLKGIAPSSANSDLFREVTNQLSSLPPGPEKSASVRSFAELIRPADPKTADLWLESLR